ncbi:hypothetical protein BJ165DRAFT_1441799 [Panaeolus papilionaceus]|nr:hypothetical protein BJ165DRAFT_1441799 [Panaeolus papilionaceus]
MDLCHDRMRLSRSSKSLIQYRETYINACILKSLTLSMLSRALDAISTLDHTFIIAGAGDDDISDLIYLILVKIQASHTFPDDNWSDEDLLCPDTPDISHSFSVPYLDPPPSIPSFQNHHSKGPFVLNGFAAEWPALTTRCWNSLKYLRSVAGPGRIVPVEVGRDYRRDDWSQQLMSWDTFLRSLKDSRSDSFYLAQHNLFKQFPALRDDISIPHYVYVGVAGAEADSEVAQHTVDGALLNIWFGPKGAMSPAHTDPYSNFYVQISGYKTVWLAPPSVSSFMSSTQNGTVPTQLANTSEIDVFSENLHIEQPDYVSRILPLSMTCVLQPGDMLFIPKRWWHAMRSESTSISVSMWF